MKIELSLNCIEKLLTYADTKFSHYDLYWIEELHSIILAIDDDTLHSANLHKHEVCYYDDKRNCSVRRIFLYKWDSWQLKTKREQDYEQRRLEEKARRDNEGLQKADESNGKEGTSTVSSGVCADRSNTISSGVDSKRLQLMAVLEQKPFLTKQAIKQIMKGTDGELAKLYKRYNIC